MGRKKRDFWSVFGSLQVRRMIPKMLDRRFLAWSCFRTRKYEERWSLILVFLSFRERGREPREMERKKMRVECNFIRSVSWLSWCKSPKYGYEILRYGVVGCCWKRSWTLERERDHEREWGERVGCMWSFDAWKSNIEYDIKSRVWLNNIVGMVKVRYVGKYLRREGGGLRWLEIWFDPVRCQLVRNRFRPNPITSNSILDTWIGIKILVFVWY